jgi:glutathione synthase/RimK-type ligase-like ATP-grasp enzyme
MIQPFLPTVTGEGELSLFFFDGVFSHGVAKVAAEGDFRVQPQFGGRFAPYQPSLEAVDLAQNVLSRAPQGLVYARTDMLRDMDGRLALMELEAIEPDLYFAYAPDSGDAFGRAVLRRI